MNIFADKDRDLPPGWEAKLDRNGKVRIYCNWLYLKMTLIREIESILK